MSFRLRGPLVSSLGAACALGALVVACSSAHPPPSASTGPDDSGGLPEGSTTGDAGLDGSSNDGSNADAGPACNSLDATGSPLVPQTALGGSAPPPAGGILFQGTYFLTERDVYNGPSDGEFVTRVLFIDPGTKTIEVLEGVTTSASGVPSLSTKSETYQVFSTVVLTTERTCPSASTVNLEFTAGGPQLMLYPTQDVVEIYTLQ